MKLTGHDLLARAEALEECAGHLELEWTDDPLERAEGMKLGAKFRREAIKLTQKAGVRRPERDKRGL
jgi:hypothetical protein